ncbi:MAG: sigma-70 family RNA polymerase sigma factor [Desulfofustis sp.]|nr:sigma-70 family RNA polymerase sigma factor [Desulfofustis sp.]
MDRNIEADREQRLIAAVARGDRNAFRQLYDETYGKVARYIRSLVGDEHLTDDILVQTYAIVWQTASRFKGASRLTTWIIGIARNIAFKEFRSRRTEEPFDESYKGADDTSQLQPEYRDRNKLMKLALATISAHHREILELVFYQDLSYPEISQLIDIPVNTVKTRVFHAKKAFKNALAARGITANDL